jgi:uncharacterized membrane protein
MDAATTFLSLMSKRSFLSSSALLLFLVLFAFLHNAYYAPQLPPVVASHFDGSGNPNGWMPRQAFSLLYAGLIVLLAGMFLLTGRRIDRVPDRMVNLPNKAYWLDPSRREETHACFRQWGYRFGSATIAFLIATMHFVVRVNLGLDRTLYALSPLLLGAFLIFTGAAAISLIARFRKIPPGTRER